MDRIVSRLKKCVRICCFLVQTDEEKRGGVSAEPLLLRNSAWQQKMSSCTKWLTSAWRWSTDWRRQGSRELTNSSAAARRSRRQSYLVAKTPGGLQPTTTLSQLVSQVALTVFRRPYNNGSAPNAQTLFDRKRPVRALVLFFTLLLVFAV